MLLEFPHYWLSSMLSWSLIWRKIQRNLGGANRDELYLTKTVWFSRDLVEWFLVHGGRINSICSDESVMMRADKFLLLSEHWRWKIPKPLIDRWISGRCSWGILSPKRLEKVGDFRQEPTEVRLFFIGCTWWLDAVSHGFLGPIHE